MAICKKIHGLGDDSGSIDTAVHATIVPVVISPATSFVYGLLSLVFLLDFKGSSGISLKNIL